jgi:16S rRNA (cytosine1402-N4)-methyltransferase
LVAFDRDGDAIARFEKRISGSSGKISGKKSIELFHDNFSTLKDRLAEAGISKVDAIVADLGISSDQLADTDRGMSFQIDAPLDMRMDARSAIAASDVVNTYKEDDLQRILQEYGEEKYAASIARAITRSRVEGPITRVKQLVEIIEKAVPPAYRHKKIHAATKTFQALRIEVNGELEILRPFLTQAVQVLSVGGRIAVITFHSGEDSIVKRFMRENARGCICPPEFPVCRCDGQAKIRLVTKKPIVPSAKEVEANPRSRSAKLRVAEKIG